MASMMTGITLMRTGSQEYGRGAVASDMVIHQMSFASLLRRINYSTRTIGGGYFRSLLASCQVGFPLISLRRLPCPGWPGSLAAWSSRRTEDYWEFWSPESWRPFERLGTRTLSTWRHSWSRGSPELRRTSRLGFVSFKRGCPAESTKGSLYAYGRSLPNLSPLFLSPLV